MSWPDRALRAMLDWKSRSDTLPEAARLRGQAWIDDPRGPFLTKPSHKLLPADFAEHNLLPSIRDEAIARFARHKIAWHMEVDGHWERRPSQHLLDSQIQCINVLLALPDNALLALVRQAVPDAVALLPVEDGSQVAFEWIGAADYLGEARGRPRQRGRFATSADGLLLALRADGGRTVLLVEWKFTEFYGSPVAPMSGRGTDIRAAYRARFHAASSPFVVRPPLDTFLHDPHWQLMRQALLASAMVDAGEFGADSAVLLHLVPAAHDALHALVPDGLKPYGALIADVWSTLLPGPRVRYVMVDNQPLLGVDGIAERYGGLAVCPTC